MRTLMENHIEKEEMAHKKKTEPEIKFKRWVEATLGLTREFYDNKIITAAEYNAHSDMLEKWLDNMNAKRNFCNQCD